MSCMARPPPIRSPAVLMQTRLRTENFCLPTEPLDRPQGFHLSPKAAIFAPMPHRIARTFGSRAEPRAVTGEAAGLPQSGPPLGADRRPPGFGETPQPLMQEHPLVSGTGAPSFV